MVAKPAISLLSAVGVITISSLSLMNTSGSSLCYAWSAIASVSSSKSNQYLPSEVRKNGADRLNLSVLELEQRNSRIGLSRGDFDNDIANIAAPSNYVQNKEDDMIPDFESETSNNNVANFALFGAATAFGAVLPMFPIEAASAAVAAAPSPFMSGLVAYGHYFSYFLVTVCLMIERLTIKENMSIDDEKLIAKADIAYGIAGTLMVYTGVLRATEYGKGFDFYSHEPLFWVKMVFVAVWGAASLFNTTIIIQRSIAIQQEKELSPITETMAARMNQILNAQLTAVATIPFVASLMARGVLFNASIPWQAEAALVPLVFAGLGYKYVKEALSYKTAQQQQTIPSE